MGHRGALYQELENTLAGFRHCLEIGVDAVELDVFLVQDGELVVFHGGEAIPGDLADYCHSINLLAENGPSSIMELTKCEIDELEFNVDHPEFACPPHKISSAKIPTLRQVLELYQHSSVIVKIELKGPGVVEPVLSLVQELNMQHQCHFASFHHDRIRLIRELHPELAPDGTSHVYKTGALFADTIPDDFIAQARHVGASEVHLKYDTCTVARITEIHDAGMASMAWFRGPVGMREDCQEKYLDVANEDERMYAVVAMTGVQQMCCNRPDVLIDMLKKDKWWIDHLGL